MKAAYLIVFIIFITTISIAESGVHSYGSKQNYKANYQYSKNYDSAPPKYYNNQKLADTASMNASNSSLVRKVGVSAWGIIAIILGIIILSTITYYAFMLYPYICKRDQITYDMEQLTEVNSVCTVSDNTNNMPLYHRSIDVLNNVSNNIDKSIN
ncbi:uncharacterized protein LOC114945292 [Nylanderia fulva]|uniref:uncharacterized protein LOC114945292 n=1 Tax=Nylanderia fulva TaxID=613905 RepID=UPI0010FB4A9A|nr:uncharacterized protein LOC114945292 [Nylanderia fulva]